MPRNGSGTYSVPNTFTAGTQISSSAVNSNLSDIGSEITGSLPRDGQAGMTGQLKAASGSVLAPGLSFGSDTDTGLYRKAGDTIGVVAGGTEVATISPSGIADQSGLAIVAIPVGVMLPYGAATAPSGWVRANGRTIGNAASSATERANADTLALFTFLWTNFANTECAVSGGRGANAAADYAANKTISLPDMRGRGFFGLDDMGSTAAGRLGSIITSSTTNGASGGTETHTLTASQLPSHTHTGTTNADGSHTHTLTAENFVANNGSGSTFTTLRVSGSTNITGGTHSHAFTTDAAGSGAAHSNMPPAWLGTFIIKL